MVFPSEKFNGFVIVQHVRIPSLVAARASLPGCADGRADHSDCDKDTVGAGFPGEETSDALIKGTAIQKRRGDETEARAHVRQDRKGSRRSLCARNVLPRAAQGKLRLDAGRGIRVERSAGSKSLTSPPRATPGRCLFDPWRGRWGLPERQLTPAIQCLWCNHASFRNQESTNGS